MYNKFLDHLWFVEAPEETTCNLHCGNHKFVFHANSGQPDLKHHSRYFLEVKISSRILFWWHFSRFIWNSFCSSSEIQNWHSMHLFPVKRSWMPMLVSCWKRDMQHLNDTGHRTSSNYINLHILHDDNNILIFKEVFLHQKLECKILYYRMG